MTSNNNNNNPSTAMASRVPAELELLVQLMSVEMTLERIISRQRDLRSSTTSKENNSRILRALRIRQRNLTWKSEAIVNLLERHHYTVPVKRSGAVLQSGKAVAIRPAAILRMPRTAA